MAGWLIIDTEATGPGRSGFPIEIAWTVPGAGRVIHSLIVPRSGWERPDSWDAAAQRLHGITPAMLRDGGRDADRVAAALAKAAAGRTVLSDMPPFDARLLRLLCGAAAPPLADFWEVARRVGAADRIGPAVEEVDRRCPARHRAAADVARLAFLWRRIVG